MNLSTFVRSSSILTATCLLFAATVTAQGPGNDDGAHWEPMFTSTGTIAPTGFVDLLGGQPPVLGQPTQINLVAPGFDFGFIAVSPFANTGSVINLGLDPLLIYLDPFVTLGTYALPMPLGQAQLPLPLPPDPNLSGLELAFQALVINQQGAIAASNLLAGNFGLFPGGPAVFNAFQFGGNSGERISRNQYWPTTATKSPIVDNRTANAKDYTICGTKQASSGVLQIRDQTGAVLATIPGNQTSFSVSLTVPAGSKLYFYNSGTATINTLKWTIKVG